MTISISYNIENNNNYVSLYKLIYIYIYIYERNFNFYCICIISYTLLHFNKLQNLNDDINKDNKTCLSNYEISLKFH